MRGETIKLGVTGVFTCLIGIAGLASIDVTT